jgi:ferric-dicitrate binding protein FerR (iron transport regulator)
MQTDEGRPPSPDRDLWRISRETDAPDNDGFRLLDFAAFADGTLDEDDRERVAAWLAADPDAMADIAAVHALVSSQADAPAEIIARASAAHPGAIAGSAEIVRFPLFRRQAANWNGLAHWGSLAAALVVAGWLGFNLGTETWSGYSQIGQTRDEALRELLDPSAGFMRDLTDAAQT